MFGNLLFFCQRRLTGSIQRWLLRPLVRRPGCPISPPGEASLFDGYGDEPLAEHRVRSLGCPPAADNSPKRGAEAPFQLNVSPLRQSDFCGQIGHLDWPISCEGRRALLFPPSPLVYYGQKICGLWDKIPFVPDTKHHSNIRGLFIPAPLCVPHGQTFPLGLVCHHCFVTRLNCELIVSVLS